MTDTIFLMNIDTNILKRILEYKNPAIIEKDQHIMTNGAYPKYAILVQHLKISGTEKITVNRIQKNKHNISINAEKSSDEIQHLFMIKTVSKLRIEGNFLNLWMNKG